MRMPYNKFQLFKDLDYTFLPLFLEKDIIHRDAYHHIEKNVEFYMKIKGNSTRSVELVNVKCNLVKGDDNYEE